MFNTNKESIRDHVYREWLGAWEKIERLGVRKHILDIWNSQKIIFESNKVEHMPII